MEDLDAVSGNASGSASASVSASGSSSASVMASTAALCQGVQWWWICHIYGVLQAIRFSIVILLPCVYY